MTAAETWRVFAYDLNTNARICEIPASGLSFDSRLNDAGSIAFDIKLDDPKVAKRVANLVAYEGNPYAVYVDRNGVLVWGGIAWTAVYTRSTGKMSVSGKEFISYFDQRLAAAEYDEINYPAGIDPAHLMALALTDSQNTATEGPGASIGLSVVYTASGMPMIVPGYPLTQQTMVSQILNDVTAMLVPGAGGADLQVVVAYDGSGNPARTAYTRSPRSGRVAGSTGLMFDLSKAIEFTWPMDASQSGNYLTATGAGNGDATPQITVQAPGVVLGGLGQPPRLDKVESTSAQTQDVVQAMANGLAQQYGKPITTPVVKIATGGNTPLGSWIIGDDARLYMPPGDARFPNGLSQFWRIVQQSVAVPDAGLSTVELTFNPPPIY